MLYYIDAVIGYAYTSPRLSWITRHVAADYDNLNAPRVRGYVNADSRKQAKQIALADGSKKVIRKRPNAFGFTVRLLACYPAAERLPLAKAQAVLTPRQLKQYLADVASLD